MCHFHAFVPYPNDPHTLSHQEVWAYHSHERVNLWISRRKSKRQIVQKNIQLDMKYLGHQNFDFQVWMSSCLDQRLNFLQILPHISFHQAISWHLIHASFHSSILLYKFHQRSTKRTPFHAVIHPQTTLRQLQIAVLAILLLQPSLSEIHHGTQLQSST